MGEFLDRNDALGLGGLHARLLRGSVLGGMGLPVLERYYRFVATSSLERLFVARIGRTITGACVLSLDSGGVLSRFVRAEPAAFCLSFAYVFVFDPVFRQQILVRLREVFGGEPPEEEIPEVTQIYTDPGLRKKGVGTRLLESAERALQDLGRDAYCVRTHVEDNDVAIRFYERVGFVSTDERVFCGDRYLQLTKNL